MTEPKMSRADVIDMHKSRVEACMEDYSQAILAYAVWRDDFMKRHPCTDVAHETEAA